MHIMDKKRLAPPCMKMKRSLIINVTCTWKGIKLPAVGEEKMKSVTSSTVSGGKKCNFINSCTEREKKKHAHYPQ